MVVAQGRKINRNKQNGQYTSKFIGVCLNKKNGKWLSYLWHNGKRVHLGTFTEEINAAKAYNRMARELFGDNAILNQVE